MGEQLRAILTILGTGLAALGLAVSSGCGGYGGGGANVVTVTVIPPAASLILGGTVNLSANVGGATNTNVTWSPLQYTTTDSSGKVSSLTTAPTDGSFGTLSNQLATGTATYTAPDPSKFQLPDQTKFPGLQIVITATSVQDSKKSGKCTITLFSGIKAVLSPLTGVSVPIKEVQQFQVQLFNDVQMKGVTWLITQNVVSTTNGVTNTVPQLPTCSPTCGTITPDPKNPNVANYTAPATIPTAITPAQKNNTTAPSNVLIVATPVADTRAFVTGVITIVNGGPITFNGITPTIAPQGATLWDIYLNAPNISSSSIITLTDANGGQVAKNSLSGQVKILFPVPASSTTTTTTSPSSTGARLRLNETDLSVAGPFTVSVSDPAEPVTQSTTGTFVYNILPVRPTSVSTVPDDVVQGANTLSTPVTVDGGYFGANGNLAKVYVQSPAPGNILSLNPNTSDSRHLDAVISTGQINAQNPGLYPLYVASNATPAPTPNNPAATNLAVFPDYSTAPAKLAGKATGVGLNPSAIDIDTTLGVLAVAETGSNTIEFFSIGTGALTSLGTVASTAAAPINTPTGLAVNRTNHTVAVVNYGSQTVSTANNSCSITSYTGQSVTVLNIPGNPNPITPFSVDLSGALQNSQCPAPMPYSIGVDSDSNLALVAYSSNSVASRVNVGFVVNLNPNSGTNPYLCQLQNAINPPPSGQTGPVGQCISSQVTLNTGTYPRVATAPHGHLALVTPGGSGVVRGVDVTKPSSANLLLASTLTAGLVTVTVDTTKCPPGVSPTSTSSTNPCPLMMIPGNSGSVLIAGVKPGNSSNDSLFNGVFNASVTSSNSFAYIVPSTNSDSGSGGEVFYGGANLTFAPSNSATTQGVAINPITSVAAMADANSTGTNGPEIDLLSAVDQSSSSIIFFSTCTFFTVPCPNAPELLATTEVAWQPYTNALVSYNPKQGIVSVSDPVSRARYALINTGLGPSAVALTVNNGTNNPLTLWGGLAVDPATNQAFVLESGSGPNQPGQIDIVNLGPASSNAPKPTHISEVLVPSPTPGPGIIGGIPDALVPQATLTSSNDLTGVQIFGAGFGAPGNSLTQVFLDGISINGSCGQVNPAPCVNVKSDREIDVTIRATYPNSPFMPLSAPHKFALTVINDTGVQSNASDFLVVQSIDLSGVCTSGGSPVDTRPTSVAIADQIANGPFSPIALVSVTGCNDVVVLDVNPTVNGQPNPHLGQQYGSPFTVGTSPQGIAISQPLGLAVVANNGSNTASILDLTPLAPCAPVAASPSPSCSPAKKVPDVTVGTNPSGVAINDATGAAILTNTGSNSVSMINLGLLFPATGTPPTTLTSVPVGGIQQPLAVAIDPDRGTNDQGIAVVSALQLNSGSSPTGALAVVEIGFANPILSTTSSSGFVSSAPTGIVFDPIVATPTTHPGVFYANSSGTNSITQFNPDNGSGSSVSVGVNPTSLAINPQTGAILTANSASNTISIVDTLSSPFKTRQSLGIPGSPTFGLAVDQFTNLAVIVDQANKRVLLFPMPN